MPWSVVKGGGTCSADEWAVIKDSTGETEGCHGSEAAAKDQQAALYASEENMNSLSQAGAERAQAASGRRLEAVPASRGRRLPFQPQLVVRKVERDGQEFHHLHGTATVYEKHYDMYDIFGPYREIVSRAAGNISLGKNPDVAFLANHEGLSLARTVNNTLELREHDDGLDYDAYLNPKRHDVHNLVTAVEDRTIDESSFAFMIDDGRWNDDFTEFRIVQYDINRGDVSAVNYGASPWTSVAARQQEFLADIDRVPAGLARAALQRLQHRPDVTTPADPPAEQTSEEATTGRSMSVNLVRARLALMDAHR